MAYTNVTFSGRYRWDAEDVDWNWISGVSSMNVEELFVFGDPDRPELVPDSGLSEAVVYLKSGFHRSTGHQLWVVLKSNQPYTYACYTGENGTGDFDDDAAALKLWLTKTLTLDSDSAWPEGWDGKTVVVVIDPPVVVPDPVSPSVVEEADYGHLRTQFRRQSILRRRNA